MIKKAGRINELIYNHTMYNGGRNVYFLTLYELKILIEELLKVNETTEYIRFNPFYRNPGKQVEYDDYMFYMGCQEDFTFEELKEYWTKSMDCIYDIPHEVTPYDDFSENKKRMARILNPICKNNDVENYHQHIIDYMNYLDEIIPIIFSDAKERLKLGEDELAFGYICFEIYSG